MADFLQTLAHGLRHCRHSPVDISSAANPRLKQLRALLESARERRRSGQTVLDGWHLLDAWLAQGRAVQQIILPRRTLKKLDEAGEQSAPAKPGDVAHQVSGLSSCARAPQHRPGSKPSSVAGRNTQAADSGDREGGCLDGESSRGAGALDAPMPSASCQPAGTDESLPEGLLRQARWLILDDTLFDSLDILPSPAPVLALVDAPQPVPPATFEAQDIVVLDRVQDPGNVGTIIRTAAAAGIRTVLTTPGTAACWSPKVLRAGMGGHFVLDIFENLAVEELLARLKLPLAGTLLSVQAVPLYQQDLRPPLAWVFGSEGEGIDPALQAHLTIRLIIPQQPHVESLNVAAASAICLFEQRRQRMQPGH